MSVWEATSIRPLSPCLRAIWPRPTSGNSATSPPACWADIAGETREVLDALPTHALNRERYVSFMADMVLWRAAVIRGGVRDGR